jgi:hypothetical protein
MKKEIVSMETTLNIRADILIKIMQAAKINGLTRSEMIAMLLKQVMGDAENPKTIGCLVRYQQQRRPEEWRTVHITWRADVYEYTQDLRRFLKSSVSLILANAVQKYLGKLIKQKNTDNYHFMNYVIIKETIDHIICWRLIWGFPPNLNKFTSP